MLKLPLPLGFLRSRNNCYKSFEAVEAIKSGATEIDMVMNIGLLKSGDFYEVQEDIADVVKEVKTVNENAKVKVILEMGCLAENEKYLLVS